VHCHANSRSLESRAETERGGWQVFGRSVQGIQVACPFIPGRRPKNGVEGVTLLTKNFPTTVVL